MTAKRWIGAVAALFVAGVSGQCAFGAEGYIGQPADERALQDTLPKSNDPLWGKFAKCKIGYNNKTGLFSIAVTPEVKAMAGQTVTARGWVLPLDASDHTKHFLLTRRTPVCMFCPPGEPNEVAEVFAPSPVVWTDKLVTVKGTLSFINNGEKGMFFRINATTVK
ncbi:MAG TPA: DUF3299 domain-containing protein [Rhizomicrobium sp.]|nr:DUF3299 domain-containing protein [Rhizomicrobium sp.]